MLLHAWRIKTPIGVPSPLEHQKNLLPGLCQVRVTQAAPRCPRLSSRGPSISVYALHQSRVLELGLDEDDDDDDCYEPEPDWSESELAMEVSRRVMSFQHGTCTIHLIGAIHRSPETRGLVRALIPQQKPQAVFVELNHEKRAFLTYPWSEFYVAKEEAEKCGAEFILGDCPSHITRKRVNQEVSLKEQISFWEEISLHGDAIARMSLKDMEVIKKEFYRKFPDMMRAYVDGRDQYMSFELKKHAQKHSSIVAVVGAFHVAGIKRHLELW